VGEATTDFPGVHFVQAASIRVPLAMSWIDKELKRRAAASGRSATRESPTISASDRIRELWDKLESANAALPSELRLSLEQVTPH